MDFIKKNIGVVMVGIGIIVFYILMTDVFHIASDFLFPSIWKVFSLFPKYAGKLFAGFKSSMYLLIIAYFLSLVTGIAAGTVLGLKSKIRKNLMPYIIAFSAIPKPLLTPYAINIFPTFTAASIFLIWISSFLVILSVTTNAVMSINKSYLEKAAILQMPNKEKLFRVVLPAASPAILSGCSVALTLSFMMLAVAEMMGAKSGMAYFVQYYSDFARFDLVLLGFIFVGVVLVIVMHIFDYIKKKMLAWTLNN